MALRVAVDFDGVLHSYTSGWTGPYPKNPPNPGAVLAVEALIEVGYEVVVMTTRASTIEGEAAVIAWLEYHGFPPLPVTSHKIPALAYIDDRAVTFRNDNWPDCLAQVVQLKTELIERQSK